MTQSEPIIADESGPDRRSGHRAVRVGRDGDCWIEFLRCSECGALAAGAAIACRACASRKPLEPIRAVGTGTLYSWAVIHRSYPGIPVPFVSAIVDLDEGLALKGTLRGITKDTLAPGLPVRVVFDDAGGAVDGRGAPYVGFHFVPAETADA